MNNITGYLGRVEGVGEGHKHMRRDSRPAADREPKLNYATRIAPGLRPGRNQLKIRLSSLELVQNNPSSLNRNKGISVTLNKFNVVAATAVFYSCSRASLG